MGCDRNSIPKREKNQSLSVSSNGSNGLRHPQSYPYPRSCRSFSILERIEWAATASQCGHEPSHPYFQYPRTDRMGCDTKSERGASSTKSLSVSSNGSNGLRLRLRLGRVSIVWTFQYPRTDRMGCDTGVVLRRRFPSVLSVSSNGSNGLRLGPAFQVNHRQPPFSILERIEWAATEYCL